MTRKIPINKKMGYNMRLHPNYNGVKANNYIFQKLKDAGVTYIRLYSNIEKDSFESDTCKMDWLYDNIKTVYNQGFVPVLPLIIDYPSAVQDINAASNYSHSKWSYEIQNQFKRFFKEVVQHIESMGIRVVYEGFNEAPGAFWSSYGYSYNNQNTINSYLDIYDYMRNTVYTYSKSKYIELCTTGWPGKRKNNTGNVGELDTVLSMLNKRYHNLNGSPYDRPADYISYHPYVEQGYDNGAPEILIKEGRFDKYDNLKNIPIAWSEFGFSHTKDWAGNYPPCTRKALIMRQIIIGDYIGCDMMIPYSARVYNYPWGKEKLLYNWGNVVRTTQDGVDYYQFDETGQGVFEICRQLKGYRLNRNITVNKPITESNYLSILYAFEYVNDEGTKKLVYWTPMSQPFQKEITWNNQKYDLSFKYEPQFLTERS